MIAPHWTQFDGAAHLHHPSSPALDLVDLRRAHPRPQLGQLARHLVCTRMWLGWSSRVRFPERKTDESLSNVSLPSGAGYDGARSADEDRLLGIALGGPVAAAGSCPAVTVAAPGQRRRARTRAPNDWPHVPHRGAGRSRRTTTAAPRRSAAQPAAPSDAPRRLRREPPRLDRVVDPLQRRHVHEPHAVAAEQEPRRVQRRAAARRSRPRGSSSRPTRRARRRRGSRRIRGCVFSSCSRSCTDSAASR